MCVESHDTGDEQKKTRRILVVIVTRKRSSFKRRDSSIQAKRHQRLILIPQKKLQVLLRVFFEWCLETEFLAVMEKFLSRKTAAVESSSLRGNKTG
jgi:hypothetical protein